MVNLKDLKLQYLTDVDGNKTSVIIPIDQFHEMLEDIEDLAIVAERRDEPTISHEEVIKELKRDGLLDVARAARP